MFQGVKENRSCAIAKVLGLMCKGVQRREKGDMTILSRVVSIYSRRSREVARNGGVPMRKRFKKQEAGSRNRTNVISALYKAQSSEYAGGRHSSSAVTFCALDDF